MKTKYLIIGGIAIAAGLYWYSTRAKTATATTTTKPTVLGAIGNFVSQLGAATAKTATTATTSTSSRMPSAADSGLDITSTVDTTA